MVDNINSLPLNVQDNTDVVIEDNVKSLSSKATENEAINLFQRDILVFDKDETLIHIISADDYNDDVYKRQINKEWSFSFTADVSLSDVIIRKNKIGVYDREGRLQLFIVEDITERYSKTPTMEVYCIHDSFILNDTVLEEFTVTDTIDNVLDSVLAGTSYQRGYTDQFDVADIDMQLTSRFGGLQTIAETFGGELDFRFTLDETRTRILNRYVDVKFSLGRDIGVRFTFDTNLTEVVRTVTSDNHFTVLYGLGRSLATGETKPDGSKEYKRVDFSEVAWGESTGNPTNKPVGQRYIEDTEGIKKWGRIEGIYINETITDPETLINRTWKQLQKCKEPSFSYSVTVEDLSKLAGYEHLSVGIGDTVIIKDEDFKLELSARIQEEQYSIKENIIKALDAESVSTPMSARAITGLSSHGGGNKKLVLGVLQRGFTEDNSGSGTVSHPTVDTGSGDVNVDNENFPDVLPTTPIISGTGLFATIMTSWTFENSIYYGYELHGSQVENFITSQNTILARGKISSHLHQCKPGERWYFKVRAYNTHGNYTPFSNEIALESSKVADGTEWFENAAIGDALIGQLRLDRGWVGKLTGELIEARNLKVINDNNIDTLHIDNAGNVSLNVSSFSLVQGAASNVPTKNEMTNEINNIEIGGRNLIIRHTETKNTYIDTSGNIVNQNGYATSDYIELVPGGIMAFSKETVSSNDEYFRWAWYDSNKGYISRKAENSNKFKWNVPSGARYARISYHMDCYPKVERGTKHTGWSPSPEDVEYDIKNVSNNLESFENTVNTTFKDGIIEEAEAKAIKQQLNQLENTRVEILRQYNTIYANADLKGTAKTNLLNAKSAFESAHNSLVSTINTVIADGKVTSSESSSVDSTFNTYNGFLGTLVERLQEALDSIAKQKVDNVEIGGTNLLKDSNFELGYAWKYSSIASRVQEGRDGSYCGRVDGAIGVTQYVEQQVQLEANTEYTITAWIKTEDITRGSTNPFVQIYTSYGLNGTWVAENRIINLLENGTSDWTKYIATFTTPNKEYNRANFSLYVRDITGVIWVDDLKLEKGNKATDWSPAPEDVKEDLNSAVAKVDVMYYLSTSNATLAGGSWSTTAPAWVDGKYMWSKTVTMLKSGETIESNPTCIAGATGASGSDGKGIKTIVEQYYHSTSMSSLIGGSWSTTAPTPVAGKYIWTRSVITYTDDTTTTTSPICTTGAAGANAKTLDLTATSLMFTSQDGGISWAPDNGITITATCTNTSVAKWWVSPNNGSTWEELTNNGTNSTLTVTRSSFTSRSTTSLLIKCVATDSTVFDTITIGQIIGYDESKIGNRNLAQKTSDEWVTYSTFNDKNNECILPYDILLKDLTVNDTINFYFKIKFENIVKGTQHTSGAIRLQGSGDVTQWAEGAVPAKSITIPSNGTGEVIVTHSAKMTAAILKNNKWYIDFRCDYIKSGAISIKCLMVVNGKLPTAWVPAPEDMVNYIDNSMQNMLTSNNDIMDKIYLITSDNYISEAERADFKVTYEQITSQYDTMCWTIDKMNVEYLNTYKTDLTSKYNVVVLVCKPIIENNLDTGAINVRNAIVDFFSSYNNALFAVSTYTKDQLTSISLRVETLNNEFKVSSVRADDAYNATLEMGKHMKFSENWLELYGTVNGASSQFKARLSNEALEFYDGDDVVASISNKKLNIANAEIKHSLTVGRFSISPSAREAGGVVFKYNS